jgi:hypothetical protein
MSAPQSVTVTIDIGQAAAGGDSAADDYYTCHGQDGEYKLEAAYFVPMLGTDAHSSNYVSLTLGQGISSSHTDISSAMTTASTAMALGTVREFTLTENTSREFGATDILFVDRDEAGSFTDNIEGTVVCRFVKARV